MIFLNFFTQRFQEVYQNPDMVLIAFFLLTFILVFYILNRIRILGDNQGIIIVVSLSIALMGIFYLDKIVYWFNSFNLLLYAAIVGVIFILFRAFFRFGRKQF